MARDLDLLLMGILEACEDAMRYAAGQTRDTFRDLPETQRDTYRALKNALFELGEAVKSLPPEFIGRYPDIDRKGLAGLRDIVAHQYHRINMDRLWPVLTEEMPPLADQVRRALDSLKGSEPDKGGSSGPEMA